MIDTDKYEGHNAPWKVIECIADIRVVGELNEIDAQLIADAPLILQALIDERAEVKRLRELIKEIAQHDAKEYWSYELLQKVEMIE